MRRERVEKRVHEIPQKVSEIEAVVSTECAACVAPFTTKLCG
jgi:hypothetical protein